MSPRARASGRAAGSSRTSGISSSSDSARSAPTIDCCICDRFLLSVSIGA
jgi:hypothetical protein